MPGLAPAPARRKWNPVALGLLGGALFGILVIHSTAAVAVAIDARVSPWSQVQRAYLPDQIFFQIYHVLIGALGGLTFGLAFQARLAQERRAAEYERKFLQAQKLESLGRLTAGVAHDMNNFLSALAMRIHVAAIKAEDCPNAQDQLQQARSIARKAAALPRQLLAVSRRQPTQPRLVSPQRIVEETLPLLGRALGDHVEVKSRIDHVGVVRMDPVELEQVLLNLLVNARDAMPNGGTIDVSLRRQGQTVQLAVRDTGTGIPEDVRAHIFEPFFTTKPEGQGTGLGLSTCKEIVDRAGGEIRVESTFGQGTAFLVEVPSGGEGPEDFSEEALLSVTQRGHGTILVVDDQADVLTAVSSTLQAHGYEVLAATSATAALEQLQQRGGVDLLLTDVVLPGMDGQELAAKAREASATLPVILMSSFPQASLPPGARFMSKPLDPDTLLVAVHEAIAAASAS